MALIDDPALTQPTLDSELFDPLVLNGVDVVDDLVPGVSFHPAVARCPRGCAVPCYGVWSSSPRRAGPRCMR